MVWNKENFIEGFKPNYRLETGTKSPRTVSAKGYSNIYMEPEADLNWAGLSRLLQIGCVTALSRAEHIQ